MINRKCEHCGAEIPEGKDYCPECSMHYSDPPTIQREALYKRFFKYCLRKIHWIILIGIILAIAITVLLAYFKPVEPLLVDKKWYGEDGYIYFGNDREFSGEIEEISGSEDGTGWSVSGRSLYINETRLAWLTDWQCDEDKLTILGENYYLTDIWEE